MTRTVSSLRRFRALVICILYFAVGTIGWANSEIYDRGLKSTGWVIVPGEKSTSAGTCWLADQERKLVITSLHLMGESKEALVYFPQRKKKEVMVDAGYYLSKIRAINGRLVASDPMRDLAILQLESLPDGIVPCVLSKQSARAGQNIHSIGNSGIVSGSLADGTLWRYTRGNVRLVYDKKLAKDLSTHVVRLVETQSPVNQGDSGGPIFNDRGELIGVTHSYSAKERLVSHNIDVREVQSFLNKSLASLDKAGEGGDGNVEEGDPPVTLVGEWKVTAKPKEGKSYVGAGKFVDDGTFVLSPRGPITHEKAQHGRFAYANSVLWLIGEDGPLPLPLTWTNRDRFTSQSRTTKLVFERQDDKEARR